jgi:hypothetical protein
MTINWSDPTKNTQADLDAYRQWIDDTNLSKNHSDLYRPVVKRDGDKPAATPAAA